MDEAIERTVQYDEQARGEDAQRTVVRKRSADKPNQELIEHLEAITTLYEMVQPEGEDWEGKKIGYGRAIGVIGKIDYPLISYEDARQYKYIGPRIAAKVEEFARRGTTEKFEDLKRQLGEGWESIATFMSIQGVGPVKALQLYKAGRRTLDDIQPEDLTAAQQIGLKYYDDFPQKIPRAEIALIEDVLLQMAIRGDFVLVVAGSYRRGKAFSGDIDVIAFDISLPNLLKQMYLSDLDLEKVTQGVGKFSGVVNTHGVHRKIDIRVFRPEEYPTALLHSTGPGGFNTLMRLRAIALTMKLNEYGLYYYDGSKASVRTERDIFTALDVTYLSPEQRDNVRHLEVGNRYGDLL